MTDNLIAASQGTPWAHWQQSAHLARATWITPAQLCPLAIVWLWSRHTLTMKCSPAAGCCVAFTVVSKRYCWFR